ncbi:uncharacterized protein L969DRAFT_85948 [Mixia osmundae IAM 14324]|uniref:Uncharacterized protein n=1 Tax=Mixia osmundae (strain CBS 9802 / IAM 14324 / JCM 22182 / KY 12970) TaxID=764103 RepID=G7E5L3_MIXOS|nr:uncharacterized protein L969DRAFT_85948 [Mixia osmundae IAM 14324]KEI40729.1 hypothetical protein L969DRAFT_85948 [Mixia osmundae IAM 14324]GAA98123.1 hypothetical protein E5Q_04806 [Mixia osmundae IAM 14324]
MADLLASDMAAADEEDYIPGLTNEKLFGTLPESDGISVLLKRHIPPDQIPLRDLSGQARGRHLPELITANAWRAVAYFAQDQIVSSDASRTALLLDLWTVRFVALQQLRLYPLLLFELGNLLDLMPPLVVARPTADESYFAANVPFELLVLQARFKDKGAPLAVQEAFFELIRTCRLETQRHVRAQRKEEAAKWQRRLVRVNLMLASYFLEIRDLASSASLLQEMLNGLQGSQLLLERAQVFSAAIRVHIESGNLARAADLLGSFGSLLSAKGSDLDKVAVEYERAKMSIAAARGDWKAVLASPRNDLIASNGKAIATLSQGSLNEATATIEGAIDRQPRQSYASEATLYNLATLLELGTDTGRKLDLLVGAGQYGSEGFRVGCLKI